jgi:hypothetical protein
MMKENQFNILILKTAICLLQTKSYETSYAKLQTSKLTSMHESSGSQPFLG